jgi:ATP-dependent Clp protease ATP-binding subunit ClpB
MCKVCRNTVFFFLIVTFYFSVRVTRETSPEAIDKLQRQKLQLEVEIHALEREKDQASKERLQQARKTMAAVDEELRPLQAAYEVERKRAEELNEIRRRIDDLKAKADDAERRCVAFPPNLGPVQHF